MARRTQWIDSLITTPQTVAATAVSTNAVVTEAEIENLGGGTTLVRVIGDIVMARTASTPVASANLYIQDTYLGSAAPTSWVQDTYQRQNLLWTRLWFGTSAIVQDQMPMWVDLRSKRKVTQGQLVNLAIENYGDGALTFVMHLRCLFLLP